MVTVELVLLVVLVDEVEVDIVELVVLDEDLEVVPEDDLEVVEPCHGPHGWPLFWPVQRGLIDGGQTVTVRVDVTTVVSSVL